MPENADAEGEDHNGTGAERPVLRQPSQGVFAVAPQRIQHPPSKSITALFPGALDVATRHAYWFQTWKTEQRPNYYHGAQVFLRGFPAVSRSR
jgi:hypothetical protein